MSMYLVKNILRSKKYSISKIYSVATLKAKSSVVLLALARGWGHAHNLLQMNLPYCIPHK
jgi:hypothetical protein